MLLLGVCLTIILQSHTSEGAINTRNYTFHVRDEYTIHIPGTTRTCCNGEYITNIKCVTERCSLAIRFVEFNIPSTSTVMLFDGNKYISKAEWNYVYWKVLPEITSSSAKIHFITGMRRPNYTYTGIDVKVEAVQEQFTDTVLEKWRIKGYLPKRPRETFPDHDTFVFPTLKPGTATYPDNRRWAHLTWFVIIIGFMFGASMAKKEYSKSGSTENSGVRPVNSPARRLAATTSTIRIGAGAPITTRTQRPRPADRPRPVTSSTSRNRPRSFLLTRPGVHAPPPSSSSPNITHSPTGVSNHGNSTQDGAVLEAVIVEPHRPTPSPPPYDEALSLGYDPCCTEAPPPAYEDVVGNNPPPYLSGRI